MPLGRRTDCGDARFAGVELALPASDPEAVLQVTRCLNILAGYASSSVLWLHRILPILALILSRRRYADHPTLVKIFGPCSP